MVTIMKKLIIALVLVLCTSSGMATEINLVINHNVDGTPFKLNTEYLNADGVKYKITRLEYYMCLFEIDGQLLEGKYILGNGNISNYYLGNLDVEEISKVKVSFGVEKQENIGKDPNRFDLLHPLAPKNPSMHWGWNAGYRFWAIEGVSDPDGDGQYDKSFQYHILGDESFRSLSFDLNTVKTDGALNVEIDFNLQKLLAPINMTQFGIFHDFYNNSKEIRDLVDNITTSGALTSRTTSSVESVNKSIDISPNPSSNYLNVDSKFINSNYKIISMNGSTTQTGIINGNRIEIKDLTTGTFIIMIKDRIGNINTAKFLKQ